MAYRFAAAVGLVGLVAALPAPQATTTVYVTHTAGAPATATETVHQNWTPPQQPQQPQWQQPQGAPSPNPSPVVQSSPVVQQTGSHTSSTPQSTSSNTPNTPGTGSSSKFGGGICVDGTMGDTQTAANSVAGSSAVKWWNNWSDQGSDLNNGAKFFPMLHAPGQKWTGGAPKAKDPSAVVALAYNEADVSNLDPSSLCQSFQNDYLKPAKQAGMKTSTPSITSSDCKKKPGMGSCWMDNFFSKCGGTDVDFVNAHFYLGKDPTGFASGGSDGDFNYFKDYVTSLASHGKPIIFSELGLDPTVGINWSTQQVQTFMTAAVKYLESRSDVVAGWAAYQVGTKPGNMNVGNPSTYTSVLAAVAGGK